MTSAWDSRYNQHQYVYGKEPNAFFRQCLEKINSPGTILLPGEGEGRNAVYAAGKGWTVDAIDQSSIAKSKAEILAKEANVEISYHVADFFEYPVKNDFYDAVGLFFLHVPSVNKKALFDKAIHALKHGGYLFAELFSKEQLSYLSGGPRDIDLLYSKEEIKIFTENIMEIDFNILITELNEGSLHIGKASTIRFLYRKP